MTKFILASDLHLDLPTSGDFFINNDTNADVLILAGDVVEFGSIHLDKYHLIPPSTTEQRVINFFQHVSKQFPTILWVMGNHEHYGSSLEKCSSEFSTWLQYNGFSNVYILHNSTHVVNDVTFVGTTLWTNLNKDNPIVKNTVYRAMKDYTCISTNDQSIVPDDVVSQHISAVQFLENTLETVTGKVVVITHHHPSLESIPPQYQRRPAREYDVNYAYASDLIDLVERFTNKVKFWCCGHIHTRLQYEIQDTTILCNPRGYYSFEPIAYDFVPKTFEIP